MNSVGYLPRIALPLLVFSFVSNAAILVNPLFMMQVLDRVVPSGNVATLLLLAVVALSVLLLQAFVEWGRDLALARLSRWGEREGSAFAVQALKGSEGAQLTIDRVARFRQFISGQPAVIVLGLPWLPLFIAVLWGLHSSFLVLLIVMTGLLWISRWGARSFGDAADRGAVHCAEQERVTLVNAKDFARRLGVAGIEFNLLQRFLRMQTQRHSFEAQGDPARLGQISFASLLRSSGQVAAMGLGALLVTQNLMSAGGMIAASLILNRTYSTIEGGLTHWSTLKEGWNDYLALKVMGHNDQTTTIEVAELEGRLRAEGLIVPRGGGAPPILDRVSFSLRPGECLAIVGGAGAGKTTLLHALSGVKPATIGSVFLDESEIRGVPQNVLYRQSGYLPQLAELVPGTLAENIACFEHDLESDRVIDAAKMAGVHGLISALPEAYSTDLNNAPHLLSAGQRQRIALARALYNRPRYLFLDEPNALLDSEGERILARILQRLKAQGTTVVMVLHRSGLMGLCDKILRLEQGRMVDFGPRVEVLARISSRGREISLPLLESSLQDLRDWVEGQFLRESDAELSHKAQLVAMELFRILLTNGDADRSRAVALALRFLNDNEIEMTLSEENGSNVNEKMRRLQVLLEGPRRQKTPLKPEEVALQSVAKMTDRLEVNADAGMTVCIAALSDGLGGRRFAGKAH